MFRKFIFSSAFLLISVNCQLPDSVISDHLAIYQHRAVQTRRTLSKPVKPSQVTYYLYTIDKPKEYVKLDPGNLDPLAKRKSKIVFFMHGWTNSREIHWYEQLKNAFLSTYGGSYSIVQVDWREPANQPYSESAINTYEVAKFVALVIIDLHKNYEVKLDDILLVGHSLGGHMVGFVGKHVQKMIGQKLPRVIALDPAGPLFDSRSDDKRLNEGDADVVQVIHSDGGTFGFEAPTGTIDFFPNGGASQPSCKSISLLQITNIVKLITCDHHKAHEYFVQAILNPGELMAKRCQDWGSFQKNKCENVEVALGNLTTKLTGKFYLETGSEKLFSKHGQNESKSVISNLLSFFSRGR